MKYLVIAATLLALTVSAAYATPTPSTLTLENQPAYGDDAVFSVHLGKHYSNPKLAIWCSQPGWYAAVSERRVVKKYSSSWDGTVTSGALDHYYWDSSQLAHCSAVIFLEPRSAKRPEVAITEWVDFTVLAEAQEEGE